MQTMDKKQHTDKTARGHGQELVDISGCLAGNANAWQRFMEECEPVVRKAVAWTLNHHNGHGPVAANDVDDVVQEVLLRLVRGTYRLLATYDPARSSLSTWLCVVSRSATLDHLRNRKNGYHASLYDCDEPALGQVVEEFGEELGRLRVPEGLLSGRQRQVVRLTFERDMDTDEIASAMDVHPQTVRSLRHAALVRLRSHFGVRAA